ncbi:hypothetical protein [Thermaurantimonas aggregans]|uniref:hypothetical protein n=2 Tax=Thermaurantimonas TaxID=2681566 RepID=UPI0023F33092|nr:hypothetical protein [Thermaurantimonas aggregans]MCX8149231.1 hypothetical protein [Thermaurantimonas aggregans]
MRAEIKSHFNGPYLEVTPETDAEKAWMDDFKKTRKNRKILVHFGRGKMRVFDRTKVEESIFQTLFPSLKLRARIKK